MEEKTIRRSGIAGVTVALVTSAALGAGVAIPASCLAAEDAGTTVTEAPVASDPEATAAADAAQDAPAPDEQLVEPVSAEDSLVTAPVVAQSAPLPSAPAAQGIYPAETAAIDGQTMQVGVPVTYETSDARDLLDTINQARAQAATEGITINGTPVSGCPVTWSTALEYVAQIRATETAIDFSHIRPFSGNTAIYLVNQEGMTFSDDVGATITVNGENLAYGSGGYSAADLLQSWLDEKKSDSNAYTDDDFNNGRGHYMNLISDSFSSIGLGCVTDATGRTYLTAAFAQANQASSNVRGDGSCLQMVNVSVVNTLAAISGASEDPLAVGATLQLSAQVEYITAGSAAQYQASGVHDGGITSVLSLTWQSSDPNVTSVDASGLVSAISAGDANISLLSGDTTLANTPVSVAAPAPTIVSIDPLQINTLSGTAPDLPETVTATMSDGSAQAVGVTWAEVDPSFYSAREGNIFTVHGTVDGFDAGVDANVTVDPATVQTAGVAQTDPIVVTAGQAPDADTLPQTASVTWSNGDTTNEDVTWDAMATDPATYAQAGEVTATGTAAGVPVSVTVTVEAAPVTIESVENPGPVSTQAGVQPELPQTATATLSDGTTSDVAVTWAVIADADLQTLQDKTLTVQGTVEGYDGTVEVTVNVAAAEPQGATIDPATATVAAGTVPELPGTATVTWSDGETTDEDVTWDASATDPATYAQAGEVDATGTAAGVQVTVQVTVTDATIVSVADVDASTFVGTPPALPAQVQATMTDGTTQAVGVTWDAIDPSSYAQAGAFDVAGAVEGAPEGVGAVAHVTVKSIDIESVQQPTTVQTIAGIAPGLPAEATATMSDGSTRSYKVIWNDLVPSQYAAPNTFEVLGTLEGTNVTVSVKVEVISASVQSVQTPIELTTTPGKAPTLPQTLQVTWNNGQVTNELVTWSTPAPALYEKAGNKFQVSGTCQGLSVIANVTVTNSDGSIVQTGDETSLAAPVVIAGAGGIAAVLGAVLLRLRKRFGGKE